MITEPLRWFFMLIVAASGYFTITSNDMGTRAFAFIGSVVSWQAYCVILMYEADLIRSAGMKKKAREAAGNAVSATPSPALAAGNAAAQQPLSQAVSPQAISGSPSVFSANRTA